MNQPSDQIVYSALRIVSAGCFLMLLLSTGIVLFAPSEIQDTEQCKDMLNALKLGWQSGFTAIVGVLAIRQAKSTFGSSSEA